MKITEKCLSVNKQYLGIEGGGGGILKHITLQSPMVHLIGSTRYLTSENSIKNHHGTDFEPSLLLCNVWVSYDVLMTIYIYAWTLSHLKYEQRSMPKIVVWVKSLSGQIQ